MDKEQRNEYIRKTYVQVDDCTMGELADVYHLTQSQISSIINEDPTIETGGKPDVFKDES